MGGNSGNTATVTGHVMVFVPAPKLTITIEQRGNEPDVHLHAGGQGVWQARMITALGVPVVLCTALGGETGRVLASLLAWEGVQLHTVAGGSRNGTYVHDRRGGIRVDLAEVPPEPLSRHELDELYGLALAQGLGAEVCLLSGAGGQRVVPPDAYRRLAKDLGRNGRPVLADLAGDYLAAVLQGFPRFIKVSHDELIADGRAHDDSTAEMVRALFALRDAGAESIVVSRGARPALALIDDSVFEVVMPEFEAVDPRGAGDSMTAGVAATMAQGMSMTTAIRIGAAAGALNVTRHGLGTGRADGVSALAARVELLTIQHPTATEPHRLRTPEDLAARTRPPQP